MPDIFQLIGAWKKQIIVTVLIAMAIAAGIIFITPPEYLSSTTAIAVNPVTADRSIVFNDNIRDLHNSLGDPSELDKIIGTAQTDTVYLALAARHDLVRFYHIKGEPETALLKAAKALKKSSKVSKTEYGALLVEVWCKDKQLAPVLANELMQELGAIHSDLLSRNNKTILESLKKAISQHPDSASASGNANLLREQTLQYQKLQAQYDLILNTKPQALLVVDKARVSDKPDTPRPLLIMFATAVVSFLFALWLALLLEKRKQQAK
jgi:uncharacterized protein involved in exopolysaccharide biosynthesis